MATSHKMASASKATTQAVAISAAAAQALGGVAAVVVAVASAAEVVAAISAVAAAAAVDVAAVVAAEEGAEDFRLCICFEGYHQTLLGFRQFWLENFCGPDS